MKQLIIFLSFLIFISCSEKSTHNNSSSKAKRDLQEIKTDSIYASFEKNYNTLKNWEQFKYQQLYELQDFFDDSPAIVVKYFNDFQLFRKDNKIFCSYKINEFYNDIFLDLSFNELLLEKLNPLENDSILTYQTVVIKIDSLKPIPMELNSEMADYHSKVILDRNISLIGTGKIIAIEVVEEKRANR